MRHNRYAFGDHPRQQAIDKAFDSSPVGLLVCFVCGKPSGVAIHNGLHSVPNQMLDQEPCDECKEAMKVCVLFVEVRDGEKDPKNPYRTGRQWGISREWVERCVSSPIKEQMLQKGMCFIEENQAVAMGLHDHLPSQENNDAGQAEVQTEASPEV